jgi:hypothetical protein
MRRLSLGLCAVLVPAALHAQDVGPPHRVDFLGTRPQVAAPAPSTETGPWRVDFLGTKPQVSQTGGSGTGPGPPWRIDFLGMKPQISGAQASGGGGASPGRTSGPAPGGGGASPGQASGPAPGGPQEGRASSPGSTEASGQGRPVLRDLVGGACPRIGEALGVRGSGFGRPGVLRLALVAGGRSAPVDLPVRSWSDTEVQFSIPPAPGVVADGKTPYSLVLVDARGAEVARLSRTFAVCR